MLKAYLFTKTRLADVRDHVSALRDDESGAALIEYAMLIGLVAVAGVAALTALNGSIGAAFGRIGADLTANVK
ncbi:MAG TPA: Flp family type IVb pilin [Phenylobacterium sp.]|jgi:Flp pilus assembly pilin Flp|nr:Flp family type IVb pilin [Phenylobacterium sp.]